MIYGDIEQKREAIRATARNYRNAAAAIPAIKRVVTTFDGKRYPAVTNVGNKPTIGEYAKNIETHVFNYDGDAYGKHIDVEFVKWTRPEQKFDGIEALQNQIQSDCITAKAYHRKKGTI